MKKIFTIFLIAAMVFSLAACGSTKSEGAGTQGDSASTAGGNPSGGTDVTPDNSEPTSSDGTKVLVAYFSATGTTKKVAEYAAAAVGADLYEIVPAEPYTSDDLNYNDNASRSTTEMNDPASRPAISGGVTNMADYDIVFIGYPIWWGEAPRIVSTFVESCDFSGKTVVTFSTSGGSAHNDRSIKSLASAANWITGTRLNSGSSQSDVAAWINGLGLTIQAS